VALAGATGVVGSRALQHLLARPDVALVVALGRRAPSLEHAKLVSKVVDFRDGAVLEAAIPAGTAIAVCCLGTTMKMAGSQDAFRAVDHDAVVAFGRAALRKGAQRFLLVSSVGADPHSSNFYLRTKGETEDSLARLGYPQLTVLRPSFIDDEGARAESRLGERLALPVARAVFSVVGRSSRYAPVRADVIATALVRLASDETSERVRVVESNRLHALGR
jgi:uncharacterized protein YbjT (DUF2867 family)